MVRLVFLLSLLAGMAAGGDIRADLTGDGIPEEVRFTLQENGLLYRGDRQTVSLQIDGPEEPIRLRDVAWAGGDQYPPVLHVTSDRNLQLLTRDLAPGLGGWFLVTEITWQSGRFVIARITYDTFDVKEPSRNLACDIDFLTRTGTKRDNTGNHALAAAKTMVALRDWQSSDVTEVCDL
ncbi:hypothetical protein [Halovulum sp. GXIMD14793]